MKRELDLGHGHHVILTRFAPDRDLNPHYAGIPDTDPIGLIDEHHRPDGTPCIGGAITFDSPAARIIDPDGPFWQLESLEPLTVSPSLLCVACGDHGFIRESRWIPA